MHTKETDLYSIAEAYVGKDDGAGPKAQIESDDLNIAAEAYVGKDDNGGPTSQIEEDELLDQE
ncbi:MAG: hypothetical protein KDD35_09900 [Bdellovibrionales bacterium]|nr:hypothetical protein [Bdellovibrionales bacterium]